MDRPRHPKPDLERVLRAIEGLGWAVDKPGKYYRCRCQCGQHTTRVHMTPSNPHHGEERLRWCRRQSCMKEEDS